MSTRWPDPQKELPTINSQNQRSLLLAALWLLSQGANAAGFLWEQGLRNLLARLAISLTGSKAILHGFTR